MVRPSTSFSRKPPKFKPQPRVLVICEDTKSSKNYLEDAAIYFRSFAVVEFSHCGRTDPLGIVIAAIKRSKEFDQVFCVVDRDSHDQQNFEQAVGRARSANGVTLLTSYPCFEFWLLIHFGYTRSPFMPAGQQSAADRVIGELTTKPGMSGYTKGDVKRLFATLLPKLEIATIHAERTLQEAVADNENNPSTPLHKLLNRLRELGEIQSA